MVDRLLSVGCGVTYSPFCELVLLPTCEASAFAAETALPLLLEHKEQVLIYLQAEAWARTWVN